MQKNVTRRKNPFRKVSGRPFVRTLVIIAVILMMAALIPNFLKFSNLMNVLRQASIIAIPAIGVTMAMITKGIDLSTSGVIAFAPMCVIVMYHAGIPFALCVLCGILTGVLAGLLNGLLIARVGVLPFIATYVSGTIMLGLAMVIGNGGSVTGFPKGYTQIGNGSVLGIPWSNIIMLLCVAAGALFLGKTKYGNRIYALGNNESVIRMEGLSPEKLLIAIYGIGGFFSAVAGLLLSSQLSTVHPTEGNSYQLDCIAACILGGTSMLGGSGTVINSALGAIGIAAMRNALNLLGLHPYVQNLLLGTLIILIVAVNVLLKQREKRQQEGFNIRRADT